MSPGRENFWACMKEAVGYDLTLRFRLLYYINRVCMAAIFGVNLTEMSVIKAIEIVLALGFLYHCARQMKFGLQESFDIMMIAIGLILVVEMFLIVFVIGSNNYSYVGLDETVTWDQYKQVWSRDLSDFTEQKCGAITMYFRNQE